MVPNIQVFIATHDRPDLLVKAINSVLQQSYRNIEIVVSDNSTNNITQEIVQKDFFDKVKYVRRTPSVDGITHFNMILKDVSTDFFMMFHDDDIMYPNMVETLYNEINSDSSIAAVAGNARIVKNLKYTAKTSFSSKLPSICITTPDEMAHPYLCGGKIAPFPSYMYRKEVVQKVTIDPKHGGKYSDTSFLMEITRLGKVIWTNPPLMDYYIHSIQDSYTNDFLARLSLVHYIANNTNFNLKSKELRKYRVLNIYNEWVGSFRSRQSFPLKKKALFLLFRYSPFNFFWKIIIRIMLKRIN